MTILDYRAALAELLAAADEYAGMNPYMRLDEAMKRARALLAAPEAVGVADEELETLIPWLLEKARQAANSDASIAAGKLTLAAQLLGERLDGTAHPAPVPVGERLPGVGDCAPWLDDPNATPWAWAAKEVDGGWEWVQISMLGLETDSLERIIAGGGWTHWLPYWALPLPRVEQ
jgi:hypothetical protein